jgi:hypothetical protein
MTLNKIIYKLLYQIFYYVKMVIVLICHKDLQDFAVKRFAVGEFAHAPLVKEES